MRVGWVCWRWGRAPPSRGYACLLRNNNSLHFGWWLDICGFIQTIPEAFLSAGVSLQSLQKLKCFGIYRRRCEQKRTICRCQAVKASLGFFFSRDGGPGGRTQRAGSAFAQRDIFADSTLLLIAGEGL